MVLLNLNIQVVQQYTDVTTAWWMDELNNLI